MAVTKEECKVKFKHSVKNVVKIAAMMDGKDLSDVVMKTPSIDNIDLEMGLLLMGYFFAQFGTEVMGEVEAMRDDLDIDQYYTEAVEELKEEYSNA